MFCHAAQNSLSWAASPFSPGSRRVASMASITCEVTPAKPVFDAAVATRASESASPRRAIPVTETPMPGRAAVSKSPAPGRAGFAASCTRWRV